MNRDAPHLGASHPLTDHRLIAVHVHFRSTDSNQTGDSPPGHFQPSQGPNNSTVRPLLSPRAARLEMHDKMYWAVRCKSCSGMVGFRDVRYTLDARGVCAEEKLPEGTTRRRCDHCGAVGDFDLRLLRPTSVKFLIPKLP
jgi:hypothetical protein